MCVSPIASDTLLITDAESRLKRRVPKLLLEFSMRQLHNELIDSPDDGGLLGAIHANTNYFISSDTMFRYLTPPPLLQMIDHHKMMCGCAICNTSKCFQESSNAWRWKQLKIMEDKADHSRGRGKHELTQLSNHILTTPLQTMKLIIHMQKCRRLCYLYTN